MYGLADCNNFFVSCERLFRPDLNGKPVVVLSNNDGCAIARSNEAKALGIKMGQPFYQFSGLAASGKVTVFSSNFMLYGDISHRVHATLAEAVPAIEIYSIDEAFLDFRGMPDSRLDELGHRLNKLCMRNVGIPVSVGISHTKTLAKIASKLCKRYPKLDGACLMHRRQDIEKVLRKFPVEDVWGIGRRYAEKLHRLGVATAFDFASLSEEWVKAQMGLTGLRTWTELHGTPAISFGEDPEPRKQICVSRSFAREITDKDELYEQLSQFISMAAEKLRKQGRVACEMNIFLLANRFKDTGREYGRNRIERLEPPTSDTLAILKTAHYAFEKIYDARIPFKKAGVVFSGIMPEDSIQMSLFEPASSYGGNGKLMSVIDSINKKEGAGSVVFASQGFGGVRMNREHLSPQYTTKFDDILKIKV